MVVPSMPMGTLFGTVFDSVHNAPLVAAFVQVDGTSRHGITTDKGAFRIDSITPGKVVLRVMHELLDSLGMVLLTDSITVTDGGVIPVALGIPAGETLVAHSCPAALRALGPSAVIGRLLEAESENPVANARVSVAWSEISIRDNLRRVARVREAKSGGDGVFRICGLPSEMVGTVQAIHQGVSTAEVKVEIVGQLLVIQGLRIGSAETVVATTDSAALARAKESATGQRFSAATVRKGQAVLSGRVVNGAGQPIVGARVDVLGTPGAALTRENGEFNLTELPAGTQTVVVRQIGFAPEEVAVELSSRAPQRITVALTRSAQVLAPVTVTTNAADVGLEKVGFTQRRRSTGGYFITADDIAKRAPNLLTDVFRTVPSLRVVPSGNGAEYVIENARNPVNGCVKYYVDGAPWEAIFGGDVDRLLPTWEIAAIEVYNGANTPMQFQAPGSSNCASIVIWSKTRTGGNRR
jgi:hypothetical protein